MPRTRSAQASALLTGAAKQFPGGSFTRWSPAPLHGALLRQLKTWLPLSGLAGPAILRPLRQCVYFVYLALILAGQSQI
jgi:hypothetical protein